jgi:triacylglycerol esterase/lipase EstA (alpha/beta hydrolase family)
VRITGDWDAAYFDELLPAEDYEVRGPLRRHIRDGRGVPLIGIRQNIGRERIEALYPPEAITRPVTAIFKIGPGHTVDVALRNPVRDESLAADFTAPFAQLLSHTGALQATAVGGLLRADATHRDYALYLMEPYDRRKTPVIMVHGLLSTPLAWASVTNDLWGDTAFRRRYQVWHYLYPTSAPFLYSAKMLRERLTETRTFLDPHGTDSASQRLMIVAHSMGGLLARTLITDSGEDIWNTVFMVPPAALRASEDDRAEIKAILHWKPRRDMRHVIFIAVPHRGSEMAVGFVGRIGHVLAGLPHRFTGLHARLHRDNPNAVRPAFRGALARGRLTSIDTLSPHHPILRVMNEEPFAPWVTVHSIIGDRGRGGPIAKSSDGVVSYASSHLDTAASELVVPTGHGAYEHPRALAEILRILNQAQGR